MQDLENHKNIALTLLKTIDKKVDGVAAHLEKLNGSVAKHEKWINQNSHDVERLVGDREDKFKRYGSVFWQIIVAASLLLLGIQNI